MCQMLQHIRNVSETVRRQYEKGPEPPEARERIVTYATSDTGNISYRKGGERNLNR